MAGFESAPETSRASPPHADACFLASVRERVEGAKLVHCHRNSNLLTALTFSLTAVSSLHLLRARPLLREGPVGRFARRTVIVRVYRDEHVR